MLATGSVDGSVRLWDTASGAERAVLKRDAGGIDAVTFSADGTRLASAGSRGIIEIWNIQSSREMVQRSKTIPELAAFDTVSEINLTLKGHK